MRKAFAVFSGVLIGCTPLFGLHMLICFGVAHLLGLNKLITYSASYINNPFSAPVILYAELLSGHWLTTGHWPTLTLADLQLDDLIGVGRDILFGSLLVGLVLGSLLGLLSYLISRRNDKCVHERALLDETARRYLQTGILNWEFVRGKLHYDPIYRRLLQGGYLPQRGQLWDLGCGRGILLALLATARGAYKSGRWPEGWTRPPELDLHGVEQRSRDAQVARQALQSTAKIVNTDIVNFNPPTCDVVLLIDVLFYLSPALQISIIQQAIYSLTPTGCLLIREADAGGGWRFNVTKYAERTRAIFRGHFKQRYYYRTTQEWVQLLEARGLTVHRYSMSQGTPFANNLLVATKWVAE